MRILIALEAYYPQKAGSAYAAYRLAKGLVLRGHEVFVVTSGGNLKTKKTVEEGITVYRISSVPFPFHSAFRFSPFAVHSVAPIVDEVNPDLIHVHDHFFVAWSVIDHVKKLKIPIVGTNHFHPLNLTHYLKLPPQIEEKIEKLAWKHFVSIYNQLNSVTTPTESSRQIMIAAGFKKRIDVISNGIDTDEFKVRSESETADVVAKYGLGKEYKKVLFVGRLEKEKSIDVTIKAISLVPKEINLKFFVVGTGSELNNLKNLATELEVSDTVIFLGSLPDEEVKKIYSVCDLFVTASTVELQGLVVMEAMASGLPIVSSVGMALHELISQGHNGFLFPNGDYKAEAEAITNILKDSEKTKMMGMASLELIKKHSFQTSLDKYEAVYRRVLHERSRSSLSRIGSILQRVFLHIIIILIVVTLLMGAAVAVGIYLSRNEIRDAYSAVKARTTSLPKSLDQLIK